MAAVTKVKVRPITPPGYEFNDKGVYTEDIAVGDQLILGVSGWSKCPVTTPEAHGVALMTNLAGERADVGIHGEEDGYSGLTPGQPLYPSSTVAGGLDTNPNNASNETQTAAITGGPTGGTFTLTFKGQTTSAIAYNATAAAAKSALEALSTIGAGNVDVTLATSTYTVIFTGTLGNKPQPLMTASGASLTGGTSPGVTIAQTNQGYQVPVRARAVTATRVRYNYV